MIFEVIVQFLVQFVFIPSNDCRRQFDLANREAMEEIVKQTGLKISSEYEAYLGKEYTNLNKIDRLMSVMESGKATTISEAIEVAKTEP